MNQELKSIIEILKRLMSFQTVEGNDQAFRSLFSYIKCLIPNNLYIEEYEFNKHPALVISNSKDKLLDLIFCTHVDIVPAEEYYCSEDKTTIKGRGSFDMKGSVAVCLQLFKKLKTSKKVALFITSDEELTGYSAQQLLTMYHSKFAIVPDGGKDFQLVKEEKGQLQVKLSLKTRSAHASQPYNGENAITSLYEVYQNLIKKYPLPKSKNDYRTSINLSTITGGEALNSVAATATMCLDIRHTSTNTKEELLNTIKSLNKDIVVEVIHEGSLFKTTMEDKNIQKYIKISSEILKQEPVITATEATSDAIYFSDKNIPTILTNPVGDYAHCPNEYVEKNSLYHLYKIWKQLLEEEE